MEKTQKLYCYLDDKPTEGNTKLKSKENKTGRQTDRQTDKYINWHTKKGDTYIERELLLDWEKGREKHLREALRMSKTKRRSECTI